MAVGAILAQVGPMGPTTCEAPLRAGGDKKARTLSYLFPLGARHRPTPHSSGLLH